MLFFTTRRAWARVFRIIIISMLIAVLEFRPLTAATLNIHKQARIMTNFSKTSGNYTSSVIKQLEQDSPALAQIFNNVVVKGALSRPVLSDFYKSIIEISSLIALGNNGQQLRNAYTSALKTGFSVEQIEDLIIHLVSYLGFPVTIDAMLVFGETLEEKKLRKPQSTASTSSLEPEKRFQIGATEYAKLDQAGRLQNLIDTFRSLSEDFVPYSFEIFGQTFGRQDLDVKSRQVATLAALSTLGSVPSQLEFHIRASENVGLTREEIAEVMILTLVYAGLPRAYNAEGILRDVFTAKQS